MNNMHEDNQKERDQGTKMGLAVAHGIIKTWAGPSQSDVWTVRGVVMSNMKEIVNQRRYARFRVPKDAFAALGPDYIKVGQIINISMGGLAFRYHGSEGPSNASELDIFLAGRAFYLYKIPFEPVWDFVTEENHSGSTKMKKCGLHFKDLTPQQRSQLEYFIQAYALKEA